MTEFLEACRRGDACQLARLLAGAPLLPPGHAVRGLLRAAALGHGAAFEAVMAWAERDGLAALLGPGADPSRPGPPPAAELAELVRAAERGPEPLRAACRAARGRLLRLSEWRQLFRAAERAGGLPAVQALLPLAGDPPRTEPVLALCWGQWAQDPALVEKALAAGAVGVFEREAFGAAARSGAESGRLFAQWQVRRLGAAAEAAEAGRGARVPAAAFVEACRAFRPALARWYYSPQVLAAELADGLEALCAAPEGDPELERLVDALAAELLRRAGAFTGAAEVACCRAGRWGRARRLRGASGAGGPLPFGRDDWAAVLAAPGREGLFWLAGLGVEASPLARAALARRTARAARLREAPAAADAAAFLRACRDDSPRLLARHLRALEAPGVGRLGFLVACAAGARAALGLLLGLGEVDLAAAERGAALVARPGRGPLARELLANLNARGLGPGLEAEAFRGACRAGDPALLAELLGSGEPVEHHSLFDAVRAGNLAAVGFLVDRLGVADPPTAACLLADALRQVAFPGAERPKRPAEACVRAVLEALRRAPGWHPACARRALVCLGDVPPGLSHTGAAAAGVVLAAADAGLGAASPHHGGPPPCCAVAPPFCQWRSALGWAGSLRAAWTGAVLRSALARPPGGAPPPAHRGSASQVGAARRGRPPSPKKGRWQAAGE